jgi:hypothetical protein
VWTVEEGANNNIISTVLLIYSMCKLLDVGFQGPVTAEVRKQIRLVRYQSEKISASYQVNCRRDVIDLICGKIHFKLKCSKNKKISCWVQNILNQTCFSFIQNECKNKRFFPVS